MRVQYPKLYNMTHLLALNVLLLPKDLTIIFIDGGYIIIQTSTTFLGRSYGQIVVAVFT